MSVGTRRLAAAQRTAASTNPSTARRLGAWIIIVPALSLFSFSIVASAAGFQSSPDLASSAAKVVPEKHNGERKSGGSNGGGENKQDGELVLVDASHEGDGGIASLLGRGDRQMCWISKSQLVRVSAVYRTSTSTVRVGHRTYGLVTVFGANERDLRSLLGAPAVQCKLVHAERRFFLPFDPNLS